MTQNSPLGKAQNALKIPVGGGDSFLICPPGYVAGLPTSRSSRLLLPGEVRGMGLERHPDLESEAGDKGDISFPPSSLWEILYCLLV